MTYGYGYGYQYGRVWDIYAETMNMPKRLFKRSLKKKKKCTKPSPHFPTPLPPSFQPPSTSPHPPSPTSLPSPIHVRPRHRTIDPQIHDPRRRIKLRKHGINHQQILSRLLTGHQLKINNPVDGIHTTANPARSPAPTDLQIGTRNTMVAAPPAIALFRVVPVAADPDVESRQDGDGRGGGGGGHEAGAAGREGGLLQGAARERVDAVAVDGEVGAEDACRGRVEVGAVGACEDGG